LGLRIAVDLDDVLNDYTETYIRELKKLLDVEISYESITTYEIPYRHICRLDFRYVASKCSVNKFACEHLNSLDSELFVITAREADLSYARETSKWIKDAGLDARVFFSTGKAELAKQLGVDLFIEDNPTVAINVAKKGIPVFLIDKPWNRSIKHKKIHRVEGWQTLSCILDSVAGARKEAVSG